MFDLAERNDKSLRMIRLATTAHQACPQVLPAQLLARGYNLISWSDASCSSHEDESSQAGGESIRLDDEQARKILRHVL